MLNNPRIPGSLIFLSLMIIFAAIACNSSGPTIEVMPTSRQTSDGGSTNPASTSLTAENPIIVASPSVTIEPSQTASLILTQTSSVVPTITPSQTPTITSQPSPTATYAILRGTVLEQANCRYGPGAAYLYKYGLYAGNNLEIIGRNDPGTWIVVQAIGGNNPCWIKASLMDIHGEVMSVAPASLPLPQSPYYGPVSGASAVRKGEDVFISWDPINLRAGDDSLQYPYLVEAWLCQDGQFTFYPIGSWETMVTVKDEPGCSEASHARVYGVEKHGYTNWVTIPWPIP